MMIGMTRSTLVLVLVLAAGVSGCGIRGETMQTEARNAVPGLAGRSCEFVGEPAVIPPFASLARLGTRGNIALWGLDAAASDSVVVSVRYGEDGRLAWVRSIGSSLPLDRVASLERLLLESLNERGPAGWGVRLRIIGGDFAGMEPSVVCPVEPRRGGSGLPVFLPSSQHGLRALQQVRGRSFPVEIAIDDQGRIMDVRLVRPSGSSVVDQFLVDWIYSVQFQPKLHDGIPLADTIERTLYIPRRR